MMAQRRSGTFVRTNFLLSILCFVLVLYSTFLTRSGVLGETSVHSFVDPGNWAYWLLLAVIFVFGVFGFGLLLRRIRQMPRVPVEHSIFSREFALYLGAFTICFAAIFITIGTSSPIITGILKGRAAAVDIAFYVKTTLPLGIALSLLAGIGQLLWWKSSNKKALLASLLYPLISAVVFTCHFFIRRLIRALRQSVGRVPNISGKSQICRGRNSAHRARPPFPRICGKLALR
ncbi:MAG: hypothetical protein E6K56_00845 [Ignavibacteria bacterium]|nr:MAG: hypothetical protein E6K56_00845 [Ignavibacteria bacterium]